MEKKVKWQWGSAIPDEKILCGLEDWDTVLDYYRPNGSSRSWYIQELGKLRIPTMWGNWNLYRENGEPFDHGTIVSLVTPYEYSDVTFIEREAIQDRKHLYLITVFDANFFTNNEDVGFKCIHPEYRKSIREGICKVVITLPGEGYSGAKTNRDLEILQSWIDEANFPEGAVHYISGNLAIQERVKEKKVTFTVHPVHFFENWASKGTLIEQISFEPFLNSLDNQQWLFLSFNRLPRRHRAFFISLLEQKGLMQKGMVSFGTEGSDFSHILHSCTNSEEEHQNLKKCFDSVLERAPIELDSDLFYNQAHNLGVDLHKQTFISVVTETLADWDGTLFFSEKIWKPIVLGHPFMLIGNKGGLKYLRERGFKTFGKWIDESYDELDDWRDRVRHVVRELERLNQRSVEELIEIREEMKEICLHNKNLYHLKVPVPHTKVTDVEDIIKKVHDTF